MVQNRQGEGGGEVGDRNLDMAPKHQLGGRGPGGWQGLLLRTAKGNDGGAGEEGESGEIE